MIANLTTAIVAASYITLGLFATDKARSLWWPYSIVIFILAMVSLVKGVLDDRNSE